jgi:GNAT superfamily N-acetyltransferase
VPAAPPRPVGSSDIAAAAALLSDAYPHRSHEPEWWNKPPKPNEALQWVVDSPSAAESSPAAYLSVWEVNTMKFRMDLIVHPAWRRHGLGGRLLDFLIAQAHAVGATSLQARPYSDGVDAVRLLEARGFRETMRMTGLLLDDIDAVALEPFSPLNTALEARGIEFTTLGAELRDDTESWRKLRDTNQAAQFGWPDPDPNPDGSPNEPETMDAFRARAARFGMIPEACFVAKVGETYAGYSALTVSDKAGSRAGSGGTAVRPEHRGLGIATALKARCIHWAREHGVRRLETSSGNPAMVRVNEKFGFRRTYVEVRLVVRIAAASAATPLAIR